MGKFKKGLFLGGILGVALTWLNTSKKGKQARAQILDYSADIYEKLSDKIMTSEAWENMNKTKYIRMAREFTDKYAKENEWAESTKKMVTKLVSAQWNNLKGEAKKKKK